MKYHYKIKGTKTLLDRVVQAVKEGKDYDPSSLEFKGQEVSFLMYDNLQIDNMGSISIYDSDEEDTSFAENMRDSILKMSKKELIEYLEYKGIKVDCSLVIPELRKIALSL